MITAPSVVIQPWLSDGYSQNFGSYVFGPSGFWTMAPVPVRCAAKFDPFLSLDFAPTPLHPGAIQGKEGIKFCHLATLNSTVGVAGPLFFIFLCQSEREMGRG